MKALETVSVETGPNPTFTIIWMHGLGADGHDFEPLVPELLDGEMPALRFVFPPYQVGSYADGTQTVEVPAEVLLPHVAPGYRGLFRGG